MIRPTEQEVIAIKLAAAKRFGRDLALLVTLTAPIDACVVVAPFDLASYEAHDDARAANAQTAQSTVTVNRILWCSPAAADAPTVDTLQPSAQDPDPIRRVAIERLLALRETWPIVDSAVEVKMRREAGYSGGMVPGVQLTPGNAPPALGAKGAADLLADAPTAGAKSLWLAQDDAGRALVLRAPTPAIYLGVRAAWSEARAKKSGIMESFLIMIRQLVAWSPEPFDSYADRWPGFMEGLWNAFMDMGGGAAQADAMFL